MVADSSSGNKQEDNRIVVAHRAVQPINARPTCWSSRFEIGWQRDRALQQGSRVDRESADAATSLKEG